MNKIGFNVVIPTLNSESTIKECLSRLSHKSIEVYIIDSYSNDKTEEISKTFKRTNFIKFKWNKQYPKKRNWTLLNIDLKYDWVLFLDSDEFVNDKIIEEINHRILDISIKGYWINYENFFNNKVLKYGIKQKKLALFHKNYGLYEKIDINFHSDLDMEIHEHPIIDGKVAKLRNTIRHQDTRPIDNLLHKHIDYAVWEKLRISSITNWNELTFRQKIKYKLISSIFFPFIYFFINYFIFFGFLDGKNGLHHSMFKFNYFLNIYLILSENEKD